MDEQTKTEVIFRRLRKNGSVIAIFPYDLSSNGSGYVWCKSYQHISGFCATDYMLLKRISYQIKPYDPEVKDLYDELCGLHKSLHVINRRNTKKFSEAVKEVYHQHNYHDKR